MSDANRGPHAPTGPPPEHPKDGATWQSGAATFHLEALWWSAGVGWKWSHADGWEAVRQEGPSPSAIGLPPDVQIDIVKWRDKAEQVLPDDGQNAKTRRVRKYLPPEEDQAVVSYQLPKPGSG